MAGSDRTELWEIAGEINPFPGGQNLSNLIASEFPGGGARATQKHTGGKATTDFQAGHFFENF